MSNAIRRHQRLRDRVCTTLEAAHLAPGATLLIGVSGGPDSVCLLHLLSLIAPTYPLRLHVAHLDHGLRPESAADAGYVQELCQSLDIPCISERRNVDGYRKQQQLSLEAAARAVRYRFFAEVAASVGATAVAVGHTEDDQVETVLLHLLRGTGLPGLSGMRAVSALPIPGAASLRVLRPLLGVTREDTHAYCADHGLGPREDASNLTLDYARNRVRLEMLPAARRVNRRADRAILRLAALAQADDEYWTGQVARVWPELARVADSGVTLDCAAIAQLPRALQQRLVRHAFQVVAGGTLELTQRHVDSICMLLPGRVGRRVSLPSNVIAERDYHVLRFVAVQGEPAVAVLPPAVVAVPGVTAWGGWEVRAALHEGTAPLMPESGWRALMDYGSVGGGLLVRSRRPGDRYRPLGLAGTKKLQDLLVDAKVPHRMRAAVPVLESSGTIVWVGGQPVSDECRVSEAAGPTLELVLCARSKEAQELLQWRGSRPYNTPDKN